MYYRILSVCLSILFITLAFSDEQVVFGDDIESGFYFAPELDYTQLNNEMMLSFGARAGWIINHSLVIGLASSAKISTWENYDLQAPETLTVDFGHAGLLMEYVFMSDNLVHFTAFTTIGAGWLGLHENWFDEDDNNDDYYRGEAFFVVEPGVALELNITNYMRTDLSVSYRLANGVDKFDFEDADFSGIGTSLIFKFGKF